ncbi:mitochondrial ribosomal subunit protein-domain-containing protein [Whalleya microplaca]|nr:mitochondrial ribosomal subunit protein-domain-containing protein [Whalleya microplaca]
MASAVQSLRVCLRAVRQPPATRKVGARICVARRAFSSTPTPFASKNKELLNHQPETGGEPMDIRETQKLLRAAKQDQDLDFDNTLQLQEKSLRKANEITRFAARIPRINKSRSLWHDDEEDPDLLTNDLDEDEFDEDDILSLAHGKLEEFREYREYSRVAAWEMPLLSKLARPFEPPTTNEPLRFRFTSYMGEYHPAENKVVVEFSPRDMPLDEAQQLKMKKLLGPRYNPETDVAKMSCEQFEHQAQNKRYLGDLVDKLVAQAKDTTDTFEDVPLDTRHHVFKPKPKFPKEWRMTEERKKLIEETRQKALLLDQAKEEAGQLVNGLETIDRVFNPTEAKLGEYIRARPSLSPGRPTPPPPTVSF